MSGDVLGEWGKELWEEVRELVLCFYSLGQKVSGNWQLVPGAAVHQVKSQN